MKETFWGARGLYEDLVHPASLGFGSCDGDDYKTPRVWSEAEVLLAEPFREKVDAVMGSDDVLLYLWQEG